MKPPRLEKYLMLWMALCFALPLPLTLYFWSRHKQPPKWQAWLGNGRLVGVDVDRSPVPFTWKALRDASLQRTLESRLNDNFAERELYIRLMNEFSYRILRMCPIASTNIVVGRHGVLFESAYLHEYARPTFRRATLEKMASGVQQLQRECASRGVAFILLITPSKTSIYPEDIPAIYQLAHQEGPRAYDVFLQMLKEKGVHYVDGCALTLDYKKRSPIPVFPAGGIHWNVGCAATAANGLLAEMKAQGMDVQPLDLSGIKVTLKHDFDDNDLLELANLVFDWDYPVAALDMPPSPVQTKYNIAVVGGSFTWRVLNTFARSRQFPEVDFYYYYQTSKWCARDGKVEPVSKPAPPMDFARQIFGADCVVVEINETAMNSDVNNTTTFVPDALANLPVAGSPKAPFLPVPPK